MSEMIERVSRAISPYEWAMIDRGAVSRQLLLEVKMGLLTRAYLAIEAMRAPTAEMVKAGRLVSPMYDDPQPAPEDYWHTMIDAALSKGE